LDLFDNDSGKSNSSLKLTSEYSILFIQDVLNYLHIKDFPADKFKFFQAWPRRDIAGLNVAMTLRELKIPRQETLTIEER